MKRASDLKIERWEGEDYVITGLHHHGGVFSKREAELILKFVQDAIPVIQNDAFKAGMTEAEKLIRPPTGQEQSEERFLIRKRIISARDLL